MVRILLAMITILSLSCSGLQYQKREVSSLENEKNEQEERTYLE